MKNLPIILLCMVAFFVIGVAQEKQTVEQRLTRIETILETKFDAIDKRFEAVDKRFEDVNRRIDELRAFIIWGFGVTFAGMFSLIGFVLWDRRTALRPAIVDIEDLKKREAKLEEALRKIAYEDQKVASILKSLNIL